MVSKIHGAIMVKRPAGVWSTTLSLRLAHGGLLSCLLSWMLFLDWPDNGIDVSSVQIWSYVVEFPLAYVVVEFLSIIRECTQLSKRTVCVFRFNTVTSIFI